MPQVHYNAIRWVKADLDETLSEARAELDALIQTPEDITHLQRLRNLFREVHGVLEMVEVQGGVLLLEELRALLNVYADGAVRNQNEALEVISRAILQLPDYLDYIQRGNVDVPIVLLPLLNDLRTARGASLVSDRILILPDIMQDEDALSSLPQLNENIRAIAKALRPLFQLSLLGWYKNQSTDRNLLKIAAILHRLTTASRTPESKRLWWISQAVAEALQCHALESSITVKSLFGKIDRLLKLLISFGEQHLAETIPQELIKNLLFYVASANRGNSTVNAVKDVYQLNELGVEADALELARASMSGPNQSMFSSIATALLDDVNEIKERFEVYALSDDPDNETLESMEEQLTRLGDTLGMLGLNRQRENLVNESKLLELAMSGDDPLPRQQIQGLANVLMDVEFEIRTYASGLAVTNTDEEDDSARVRLPEHEYQKILSSVIYETLILINHCKEAIRSFVQQPGDRETLFQIPGLLTEIKGAMTMLPLPGVLPLINGLQGYINACIEKELTPGSEELDALADIVVSIEFYLESLDAGKGEHQIILEKGAESLPVLMRSVPEMELDNLSLEPEAEGGESDFAVKDSSEAESLSMDEGIEQTDDKELAVSVDGDEQTDVAEAISSGEVAEAGDALSDLDVLPADVDPEIMEIFQEEAEEEIDRIKSMLPDWLNNTSDMDTLAVIRRSFHTLKGSGRLVGAQVFGEYAWAHEDLLNRVIENTVQPDMPVLSALEAGVALLPELHTSLETGERPRPEIAQQMHTVSILSKGGALEESSEESMLIETPEAPVSEAMAGTEQAEAAESVDEDLLNIFRAESKEYLRIVEKYLEGIRQRDFTPKPDAELFRALHTLNGSARTAEFRSIYKPCALAEAYMANCEHANVNFDESFPGLLDTLCQHAHAVLESTSESSKEELPESLLDDLQSLLQTSQHQVEIYEAEKAAETEDMDEAGEPISESNNLAQDAIQLGAELDAAIDEETSAEGDIQEEEYDEELAEIFVEEALELLDSSENAMASWQDEPTDLIPVRELQRYLHTLKGGARMAGFRQIGDLSHAMESLFLATVEGQIAPGQQVFATLHGAFDQLQGMVSAASAGEPVETNRSWVDKIEQYIHGDSADESTQAEVEASEEAPELSELPPEPIQADEFPADEVLAIDLSEATDVAAVEMASISEPLPVSEAVADMDELTADSPAAPVAAEMPETDTDGATPEAQATEVAEAESAAVEEIPAEADEAESAAVEEISAEADEAESAAVEEISAEADEADEAESAAVEEISANADMSESAVTEEVKADIDEPDAQKLVIAEAQRRAPVIQPKRLETTGVQELVRVRSELLDQLVNNAGEVNIYHSRVEEQVVSFSSDLQELEQTIRRLAKQLRSLEAEAEAQILSQMQRAEPIDFEESLAGQDFDPLELDRYSTIQQLSRGLAESISDLLSIQGLLQDAVRNTETLLSQQTRVSTDLQDGLMRTRMVPFNTMLPRMRRVVRQTAAEMGKEVELSISGEASEVDRKLLDSMTVPLEHMLRNAIAHGIETPDVREQNDKRRTGSISVSVNRQGNEVVILVEDDGAGLNVDQIRQKARDKGMIGENEDLSDQDIIQLILESGFSTADELTQVAGRGVGMDIVNTEIKQLNGSLAISSRPGQGTCFRITLPFTLAINQALLIQSDDELYAIPMSAVEGVVRMSGTQLAELINTGNTSVEYAGQAYELKQLSSLLHQTDVRLNSSERAIPVLLLRSSNYRIALLVTEVLGNREVVVKSLGSLLSTLASVSGATILGDGKVVLVLDVAGLIRAALTSSSKLLEAADAVDEKRQQTIMVVDDSITIRKVTARMLERHNFHVVTAKDGVDAVAKLQETKPDLMLLDIEMPRMDGYELAGHIRNQNEIKDLPIIMITSRTGRKHKDRAYSLGVNQYLGKPYQEGELMENINELLSA